MSLQKLFVAAHRAGCGLAGSAVRAGVFEKIVLDVYCFFMTETAGGNFRAAASKARTLARDGPRLKTTKRAADGALRVFVLRHHPRLPAGEPAPGARVIFVRRSSCGESLPKARP